MKPTSTWSVMKYNLKHHITVFIIGKMKHTISEKNVKFIPAAHITFKISSILAMHPVAKDIVTHEQYFMCYTDALRKRVSRLKSLRMGF